MQLYTKSLKEAETENNLTEPHVIISIRFPEERRPTLATNKYTRNILYLAFSDVGRLSNPVPPLEELSRMPGCIPFSEEMAQDVVDLLESNDVEHIIVHCLMGSSRSPSLANAISMHYNGKRVTEHPSINNLVYTKMLKQLRSKMKYAFTFNHRYIEEFVGPFETYEKALEGVFSMVTKFDSCGASDIIQEELMCYDDRAAGDFTRIVDQFEIKMYEIREEDFDNKMIFDGWMHRFREEERAREEEREKRKKERDRIEYERLKKQFEND